MNLGHSQLGPSSQLVSGLSWPEMYFAQELHIKCNLACWMCWTPGHASALAFSQASDGHPYLLSADAVMFYAKQAVQQAFQKLAGTKKATKPSRYVPDCTRCIDHFAIHAG